MKKAAALGVAGLASLAFQTSDAAVLSGTLSNNANTCPRAIGLFNGDDCSYNASSPGTSGDPWVGPGKSQAFYAMTTNFATPVAGDGKVNPSFTADLTIGAGNMVSGTLTIGAVAVNNFSAGPRGRGEESWDSITITLAPKAADSVDGNTLIIGDLGMPALLVGQSDLFPSETGADSNNGGDPPERR